MCGSLFGSTPKIKKAAAAPIPAAEREQLTPELGGSTSERDEVKSRSKGRNSLKIDLQAGNAAAGGTGLNIPKL